MSDSASVEDHYTNYQAQEKECSDDEAGDKAGVVVLFIGSTRRTSYGASAASREIRRARIVMTPRTRLAWVISS